ncbi:MAG: Asp-tRNA(Asn)/Glu-tRNA(Gln) amidotransferase subunit GatB [Spirochaetaceae bacterium]|nr:Asp-tRNA(Asn)/Glu-tRNA(Gln) amidotransferase subunit GatB [Spirochaetaceae bacterium]
MDKTIFETFIGLEIHIQLITKTKIFCNCRNSFGDPPNTNICPVCMGYPGALPALNKEAAKKACLLCLALKCKLNEKAVFDRKNYFYPDLPNNYQITQFEFPFGIEGSVDTALPDGSIKTVRIHEAHLEEDAGKMIHDRIGSMCDFNRAGTPLLEVVTKPDFKTGEEVEAFLLNFRRIIRYLGVSDGNMEEGSMRCDANVSINYIGKGLGKRVEVKNLNSSRNVKLAIQHEEQRQAKLLKAGEPILQETRLWDDDKKRTESMRSKEDANDYRYFPDPDLPPFATTPEFIAELKSMLVELPLARRNRFMSEYNLIQDTAEFLTEEKDKADYFEEACKKGADPQNAAAWLKGDVTKVLNREKMEILSSPLDIGRFIMLLDFVEKGKINGQTAKKVLDIIITENKNPEDIIKENNWEQVDDSDSLMPVVEKVLAESAAAVNQIKAGDMKPVGFLIGQVMKNSGGKADPKKVKELIMEKIK